MKQLRKNSLLIFAFPILLSACNKVKPKSVEKDITGGQWKITLFSEDGEDHLNDFSSYTFSFDENGTVVGTNGSQNISGTWAVEKDKSNDDSSSDVDFILTFPTTNNFDELSDDWDIVTQTNSKLELIDVSGGNGGTDLLTFEKI
ncbi:MAG: hypothetical protein WC044_05940 [Crocinitomicaceae bacterium]